VAITGDGLTSAHLELLSQSNFTCGVRDREIPSVLDEFRVAIPGNSLEPSGLTPIALSPVEERVGDAPRWSLLYPVTNTVPSAEGNAARNREVTLAPNLDP
jgi:hypothetical protein